MFLFRVKYRFFRDSIYAGIVYRARIIADSASEAACIAARGLPDNAFVCDYPEKLEKV